MRRKLLLEGGQAKKISDHLFGVFFEDLNYAADGGLYAELVQNRDFEYAPEDKTGNDPDWNSRYAWELKSYKADAPAEPLCWRSTRQPLFIPTIRIMRYSMPKVRSWT